MPLQAASVRSTIRHSTATIRLSMLVRQTTRSRIHIRGWSQRMVSRCFHRTPWCLHGRIMLADIAGVRRTSATVLRPRQPAWSSHVRSRSLLQTASCCRRFQRSEGRRNTRPAGPDGLSTVSQQVEEVRHKLSLASYGRRYQCIRCWHLVNEITTLYQISTDQEPLFSTQWQSHQ